jgi:hypothetical protein
MLLDGLPASAEPPGAIGGLPVIPLVVPKVQRGSVAPTWGKLLPQTP